MKLTIKQILHKGEEIAPLTVAEAVLVNDTTENKVLTLAQALKKKIEDVETNEDPSLTTVKLGNKITIKHTSSVLEVTTPSALKITYDKSGHITGSEPVKDMSIYVNNLKYSTYNTSENKDVYFGDDFTTEEDVIKLTWKKL